MIPLGVNAKNGYALVDKDMAWLADKHKWTLDSRGKYVVTGTYERRGKRLGTVYLHRVIVGIDAGGIVDHICRDTLDNRRCNLRLVDNRINQINTANRGGSSKFRGVFKYRNRWCAQIKNNQKITRLGTYKDELDAAKAYNVAAVKYFGEYAVLNEL